MAKDDMAIIVGVKAYPDLGDLQGPEHDAIAFRDWVIDKAGGDVPCDPDPDKSQVTVILSSHFPPAAAVLDAEPTLSRVERAFDRLRSIADNNRRAGRNARIGRRLYLFFAGHGCSPEQEVAALLLANATDTTLHHIPGKPFANNFYREGLFDEILLFMDCCQERTRNVNIYLPAYIDRTADLKALTKGRRFFGSSAKWPLLCKEVPIKGTTRGAFTATLLEGLWGRASEPYSKGKVTAASLANYLYENMRNWLPNADLDDARIAKEPLIDYDYHEGGSFVIATGIAPPTFSVNVHLPSEAIGQVQIRWGDRFRVVATAPATSPVCTFALERGYHLVQLVNGPEKEFEVTGQGGPVDVQL
jgi:Caspase domain